MVKVCPKCGYQNRDDFNYCIKCGSLLNQQPYQTTPAYQPSYQPYQPYQPAQYPALPQKGRSLKLPIVAGVMAVLVLLVAVFVVVPMFNHPSTSKVIPPTPPGGSSSSGSSSGSSSTSSSGGSSSSSGSTSSSGSGGSSPLTNPNVTHVAPLPSSDVCFMTPSQAVSIFGGQWILNTSESSITNVTGNVSTLTYLNGTQVKEYGSYNYNYVINEQIYGYNVSGAYSSYVFISVWKYQFQTPQEAISYFKYRAADDPNAGTINGFTYGYGYHSVSAVNGTTVIFVYVENISPSQQQLHSIIQDILQ
ncbi:zinc ribbon domain-containing protein [Metallosphaera javensis (ex Sakai et al. 2022)]|uniref:zinc ribbon domain-containing protein n=1 Tax=Metallosphaera javensis (ex Sakai et al. 2022) TaxID=2775498 RepID=UPI00258DAFDF|nr:MAG: hypothetical protein MjAS7_2058 [Metallosphaera javensis (ex Sakai et al. 2022)]